NLEIDSKEDATKATRNAAIAGAASGVLTLMLTLIVVATQTDILSSLISGWSFIDAFIMFGLAYGTYRKNRWAAAGLLAYYLLNQIMLRIDVGWSQGLPLAVVFTFLFVQGVR